jgi:hypothetical protein
MYRRTCNARLSGNRGYCRMTPARPGALRCVWHGGLSTGPRTPEGRARTIAASQAGVERWRVKMRLLKQQGLVERFPQGRKKRGTPKRSSDPTIRRAQIVLEKIMAKNSFAPARVAAGEIIPTEQAQAERIAGLACQALEVIQMVFALPLPDPEHPSFMKMVSAKKDAALSILSLQLKQPRPSDDGEEAIAELWRRINAEDAKTAAAPKPLAAPKLPNWRKS